MASFATVADMAALWRPLTVSEQARAEALLPIVSDTIRQEAARRGKNFDDMLLRSPPLRSVAKAVTVDVAARILRQSTTGEPMTQESQTAMGYNWQGTYAIPGGGMANALMNNELRRLGLLGRRMRVVDLDTGAICES